MSDLKVLNIRLQLKDDLSEAYWMIKKHLGNVRDAEVVRFALLKGAKTLQKVFKGDFIKEEVEDITYD